VCAPGIHSNDAMIYIRQRKTAKNSSLLKKQKKIFPSAALAGQKKQHASCWFPRIYIYRPVKLANCYIYYIGSGGYFSLLWLSTKSIGNIAARASGAEEARGLSVLQHYIFFCFFLFLLFGG